MTLTPGTRLGPYEIRSAPDLPGLGEVYDARDHEQQRNIALRVLRADFAADPDRLRRFEQEVARCSVAARCRWPRPFPDAAQIARGLAAAHEKGIVHRDLKPENIVVTPHGGVKVSDPADDIAPVWSPDGRRILFASSRKGSHGIYEKAANGTGNEVAIIDAQGDQIAYDWSSNGRSRPMGDVGRVYVPRGRPRGCLYRAVSTLRRPAADLRARRLLVAVAA